MQILIQSSGGYPYALSPNPPDGAIHMDTWITLSWQPGDFAVSHDVYVSDNSDDVNDAVGGVPRVSASYDPGPLELDTTYYWRVDEFDGTVTHRGDVWSFTTTAPGLGSAITERWQDISGDDLNALKNYDRFPNDPDVTEVVTQFAWDEPDEDNYGGRIHGWLYVPAAGDYTFWLNSDNQGELWLSSDDDSSNVRLIASESTWANLNIWGTGEEQSNPIPLGGGEKYYIMALWKEGGGSDHGQVAWQGPSVPARQIIPGANLARYEPRGAYGAKPMNGAVEVTQTPILQWKPGLQAASHELYFGTDEQAVRNATNASLEYKGTKALGDESYDPGKLSWECNYYWRVDEINDFHPDSPWIGNVWSFTTAGFLIVHDFESYTDDAAGQAIWQSWIDGFGVVDNGAQVGYLMPPYAEQTIVHGGAQSMPLLYNNTAGVTNSEAALTSSAPRDWTEEGVAVLSLWFRGLPGSVGGFMEGPAGTYTMTGSGADIWDLGPGAGEYHDEFHFAYKTLTGAGSITARVVSVQNTNGWAKAGVMIRETLDANSRHAFACITPSNGAASQGRVETGGASFNANETGITAPHWVKLARDLAGNFTVSHSADGTTVRRGKQCQQARRKISPMKPKPK